MCERLLDKKEQLHPKNTPVLLLAGGQGSRLSTETHNLIPKGLVKLKPSYTFIDHVLDGLESQGFKSVTLCLGIHSNALVDHTQNRRNSNLNITYSIEEQPLGTAGAIKKALEDTKIDSPFLVATGDCLYPYSKIPRLFEAHKPGTITWGVTSLTQDDHAEYQNQLITPNNEIIGKREFGWINEKRQSEISDLDIQIQLFQDGGLGIIDPSVFNKEFELFLRLSSYLQVNSEKICLYKDIFPMLAEQNRRKVKRGQPPVLFAVDLRGIIYDMGRPERLAMARSWYQEDIPFIPFKDMLKNNQSFSPEMNPQEYTVFKI